MENKMNHRGTEAQRRRQRLERGLQIAPKLLCLCAFVVQMKGNMNHGDTEAQRAEKTGKEKAPNSVFFSVPPCLCG